MNAREFMIGDWAEFTQTNGEKFYAQVEALNSNSAYSKNGYFQDNAVSPISLSSEILQKNFKLSPYGVYCIDTEDNFIIDDEGNFGSIIENNGIMQFILMKQIKYVHELQHALRFCNIEQEITL